MTNPMPSPATAQSSDKSRRVPNSEGILCHANTPVATAWSPTMVFLALSRLQLRNYAVVRSWLNVV